MAKPWPERPVSEANKSGKQSLARWEDPPIRACSETSPQSAPLLC